MARRVTVVIVATVVATLLVAGLGTLVLARLGARNKTKDDLRAQADRIAATIADIDTSAGARALTLLGRELDLQGIQVMRFGPNGNTIDSYPDGVQPGDLDLDELRAGKTLTGSHGSLVYAAAPASVNVNLPRRGVTDVLAVVVLTRQIDTTLGPATGWFLLTAAVTLVAGAMVAWRFGRRIARPLQQADDATRRIATGDLSARVPVPETRDELAALVTSINTMAESLERSQGLERQFLLSISHDLRTPLTSIRGYAEALADGALDDPAQGGAVILSEARRLERLVRDLLDLAKLEAHHFSLSFETVDLVDVAIGTGDGFRPEADDASITIDIVTPNEPVLVSGDPDRLAQVAANLIENALKFARSSITVRVTANEAWARFDVVDDGPGIASDDVPHVFERLYVARREPQRKETGSGLGLAIVRELVAAMAGTVEATSTEGAGACLSMILPRLTSASTTTNSTAYPSSSSG